MSDLAFQELKATSAISEFVLAHLVRCEEVFFAGKDALGEGFFNRPGETGYQAVWDTTKEYYDKYHSLPKFSLLSAVVMSRLQCDPTILPETIADTEELLRWIYGPDNPENDMQPAQALELLQSMLLDRNIGEKMQQATGPQQLNPDRLPEFVKELQDRVMTISSITKQPEGLPVPMSFAKRLAGPYFPTGVPIIDKYMGGKGSLPREAHIVLGPTGVGKTTVLNQIGVSMAKLEHAKEQAGEQGGLIVQVSYEDDLLALQLRTMSNGARIHRASLEAMTRIEDLSTAATLRDYERKIYRENLERGKYVPGERERLEALQGWLYNHLRLADFSGTPDESGIRHGKGGIPEICGLLQDYRNRLKRPIVAVLIDWAGMCVANHLNTLGKDPDRSMTSTLSRFVGDVHTEICTRFDCVAYIAHQLSGEVNGRAPTSKVSHADAMGCKSFGVNAWYAFVLSNKDLETNTCMLSNTKGRRSESQASTICKIRGEFCELVDGTKDYAVDKLTHQIRPRAEVEALNGPMRPMPNKEQRLEAIQLDQYDDVSEI